MRKQVISCMLVAMLAGPVCAQRPLWWLGWRASATQAGVQGPAKLATINVSHQLDRRMATTFAQAYRAQAQLPANRRMIMGEPVAQVFKSGELKPHELYPEQTFLKNSTQTGKYLAARNNRLLLQEIRRMQTLWQQIDDNLPRLHSEAAHTPQPEDPALYLADSMPPQTTQFFIGEAHGYPEIHQVVSQVVQHLRAKQPAREMFLFTEFLPENFQWTGGRPGIALVPEYLHSFFPVWNQIRQAGVSVIGLELPNAVDDMCTVRYAQANGAISKQSVWATLEGVRLRNERWQKTLARYRAQHPDALFIIYTGADHSLYNRPFTLATPDEHTFVSALYPNKYPRWVSSGRLTGTTQVTPMRGPLERLVDQLDFQRDVVKWQSPDLVTLSGFDVRIKLPVKLPEIDY